MNTVCVSFFHYVHLQLRVLHCVCTDKLLNHYLGCVILTVFKYNMAWYWITCRDQLFKTKEMYSFVEILFEFGYDFEFHLNLKEICFLCDSGVSFEATQNLNLLWKNYIWDIYLELLDFFNKVPLEYDLTLTIPRILHFWKLNSHISNFRASSFVWCLLKVSA